MFKSVSRAIPKTQQTTSFVASRAMIIDVVSFNDFYITVNGVQPPNYQNIIVSAGDTVAAVVTSPDDFLWYKFLYYKIDTVPQSFAVVNKSEYTSRVRLADAIKRWYLYDPDVHKFTFRSSSGGFDVVEFGTSANNLYGKYHIVLEPISNSVGFFSPINHFISRVTLPAQPIDYAVNPIRDTLLVLVRSGEVYEIFLNSRAEGLAPFLSLRNYSEFTGDLSYLTRLPGEDLITFLRRLRNKLAIPPATCMTTVGNFLVAGGNGTVWVVNLALGFVLINTFSIDEYILDIVTLPDNSGVLVVTQSQKIYTITMTGNMQQIYQGSSLWQPAVFNGKIYIPECNIEGDRSPTSFTNEGRLLVYNPDTQQFESSINLPEFCPSYITVGSGKMYVCGHDTERILEFNSSLQYTTISFSNKVTWVSECEGSLIASHFLSTYKILIAPDLFRIIEVDFRPRTGPVSYIGTNIETVKLLGSEEVVARTPNDTWVWANGRRTESNRSQGVTLFEGDFISLSYAARVPGTSRTNCVIGDTAYDYDVTAVAQTYYARHIDLPVQTVGDFGIHTRQITLPRFFTPCLMSLEYGTLLVNGAFYFGDRLVYPQDTVEIRILAGKTAQEINSVLPIFTIGARQYVIPVAKSLLIPTQTIIDDNLVPNTGLVKTVTITTLSDFIVPGYYDLIIKKNNIDITGNYYQQFGFNDTLVIEFTSSRKRYDERDVYILGTPNYRFNAKNIIENKIGYLNFGNIQNPFPRLFHPEATTQTVNLGSGYSIANYYDLKQYQFVTANIAITGLAVGTTGNLSHDGIDTFFVHNGEVILGTNTIEVKLADNVALCRNINNFFEQTITVTQLLPDPNDDFFVDVEVGKWGVINQTVLQPPNIYYQSFSVHEKTEIIRSNNINLLTDKNLPSLNRIYYFNTESPRLVLNWDTYTLDSYIYDKFAPNQRKIFSAIESLDRVHLLDTSSMKAFVEHSNGHNTTRFELKAVGGQVILADRIENKIFSENIAEVQKYNWQADTTDSVIAPLDSEFFRRNVVLDEYSLAEKDRSKNRKIFYVKEVLDKNNLLSMPSYKAVYRSTPAREIEQYNGQHFKLPPAIKGFNAGEHYEFNSNRVDAAKFAEFSINENSHFAPSASPLQNRYNPLREKFFGAIILEWEEKTNEIYLGAKSIVGLTQVKIFEPILYFNRDKKSLAYSAQQNKYNYGTYEFLSPIIRDINVIFSPESIWQHNVQGDKYNKTYSPNLANINYADNQQTYNLGTHNYTENSQYPANKTEIEYTNNRQYYESRDRKYTSSIQQYQVTDNDLTYFGVDVAYETRDRKYATEQTFYQLTERNYANNGQLFEITENNYAENQQYYEVRLSNLADRVLSRSQKIVFAKPSLVEASYTRLERLTFVENEMSGQRLDSINFTPDITKPIQLEVADKLRKSSKAEAGVSLKHLIDMSYVNELRGSGARNVVRYENELRGLGGLKVTRYVNEVRPIEIISSLSYQNTRALEIPVQMNYTYQILGQGSQYRMNFVTDQLNVGAPVDMEFLQTEYINTTTAESKFNIVRDNPGSTAKEEFLRMQMGRESLEYPHPWNISIQRDGFADQSKFTIVDFISFVAELPRPVQSGRQMIGQVLPGNAVLLQDKDRLILSLPPETKATNLSFSTAPTVRLDKELVWNNDIEVRYGAFATEEDAILAAQIYTEFRPFLILNTNLWTYRVLLDTNLVCPLPPGRYPIAWLIRGG